MSREECAARENGSRRSSREQGGSATMAGVTLVPSALWLDEKARRAGYGSGVALARAYEWRDFRCSQLYRAATKELASDLDAISVLRVRIGNVWNARVSSLSPWSPSRFGTRGISRRPKVSFVWPTDAKSRPCSWSITAVGRRSAFPAKPAARMRAAFCATGQAGFTRHLEATEIFDQARFFARDLLRARSASPISSSWAWESRSITTTPLWARLPCFKIPEVLARAPPYHDFYRRARAANRALHR